MRCPVVLVTVLLLTTLAAARPGVLHAQLANAPFPIWTGERPRQADATLALRLPSVPPPREGAARSHTGTGLLVGGLIGAAATTIFLVGFCGDPDTACGADEVGRAVLVIAVPCAAAGALIGSLIHTED